MSGFDRPIPASVLAAGALLVATAVGVTATAHAARVRAPAPAPIAAESRTLDLRRDAGGLALTAEDGRVLRRLPRGGDGFLQAVMERVDGERAALGVRGDPPLRLVRWTTGRLSVVDPATGRVLPLDSFGRGNAGDALALLHGEAA